MKKGTICKKYTQEEKKFVTENYENMLYKDIGKIIGRTQSSVGIIVSKLGLGELPKDLIPGQKFNRLTIIKKTNKKTKSRTFLYECLCDCGKITEVNRTAIINGGTKSCGCLQKERLTESLLLPPGQATLNSLYQGCIFNAKSRGVEFLLTKEQHEKIVSCDCHYCGEAPRKISYLVKLDGNVKKLDHNVTKLSMSNSWTLANTVDRIDSSKGYSVDNCVPSCWPCNEMKMDRKTDEFLKQIDKINNFQKEKNK